MQSIASHKFNSTRQQPDCRNGHGNGSSSGSNHSPVFGLGLRTISNQDDGYDWTEEGHEHLQGSQYGNDHSAPHYVLPDDLRRSGGIQEAVSDRTTRIPTLIDFAALAFVLTFIFHAILSNLNGAPVLSKVVDILDGML